MLGKMLPLVPDDPIVLVGAGGLGFSAIAMLRAPGHQAIISINISANKYDAAFKTSVKAAVMGGFA
jgi:alcohol dehydrogenase, propanol-preferring